MVKNVFNQVQKVQKVLGSYDKPKGDHIETHSNQNDES